MKHIIKGNPPHELRQWFEGQPIDENGYRTNCSYDNDMPGGLDRKNTITDRLRSDYV